MKYRKCRKGVEKGEAFTARLRGFVGAGLRPMCIEITCGR